VTEFTIEIETAEGTLSVNATTPPDLDDVIERFAAALHDDARVVDAAASVNTRTGVLAATFQVAAANVVEAADRAVNAFAMALGTAGLESAGGQMGVAEVASLSIAPAPNGDHRKRALVGAT
jgi:hypothetical protein